MLRELACLSLLVATALAKNMNPVDYVIANPASPEGRVQTYRGEYFEIFGPATTTSYSEVFWSSQPVPLPDDIVKRFDNRVMAITGYEVDLVRKNASGGFDPVPCYEQYNHHYSGWMHGKAVRLDQAAEDETLRGMWGHGGGKPVFLPALDDHVASEACDLAGLWFNPANKITVNVTTKTSSKSGSPSYSGSCIGPVGWKLAELATTAPTAKETQGGASLHVEESASSPSAGGEDDTGVFSTSPAAGAPPCSMLTWRTGNNWYRKPFVPPAPAPGQQFPSTQVFSEGNGNEHRASYKGYAPGFAQLIASPTVWANSPMIINLNKRLTKETTPGPVASLQPRRSLAPRPPRPDATYNGVLECPCTDRKVKIVDAYLPVAARPTPSASSPSTCYETAVVDTLEECAAAAAKLNLTATTASKGKVRVVQDPTTPNGCFVALPSNQLTFNNYTDLYGVSPSSSSSSSSSSTTTLMALGVATTTGRKDVCRDVSVNAGSINGVRFINPCAPFPKSQLIETGNAICNISAYNGGLRCCTGGSILLDKAQVVPAQQDTWYMKYRFYFEDYSASKPQSNLFRVWWSTEAFNNEYDVPESPHPGCRNGEEPAGSEKCVHEIKSVFTGHDMLDKGRGCMASGASCADVDRIAAKDGGKFRLLYAAAHCHAPACQSLELWDNDANKLLCRNEPLIGQGKAPTHDEKGYVVGIPPCLWGVDQKGLLPPPILSLDGNYTTIKRANSTWGHWGVMALWQMRGSYM
eukprot:g5814.t1